MAIPPSRSKGRGARDAHRRVGCDCLIRDAYRCRGLEVLAAPHRRDRLATVGILLHSQGSVTGRVVRRSTGAQHKAQRLRSVPALRRDGERFLAGWT
jgi:hypothetical protein